MNHGEKNNHQRYESADNKGKHQAIIQEKMRRIEHFDQNYE